MKILIFIILFSSLLFSCNKQQKYDRKPKEFILDDSKFNEINEIIEAIIIQDSLQIHTEANSTKALSTNLFKVDIVKSIQIEGGMRIPPSPGSIYLQYLFSVAIKRSAFFSREDSIYILSQNSNPDTIGIRKNNFKNLNLSNCDKSEEKFPGVYQFSIPIFSPDNKKTYVQLNYYCGSLCGWGKDLFLEKINGKWKIVYEFDTWIS